MMEMYVIIALLLMLPATVAFTEVQYSLDNITFFNATSTNNNETILEQLDDGINENQRYYFRVRHNFTNEVTDWVYVTTRSDKTSEDNNYYIYISLFILFGILLGLGYYLDSPVLKTFSGFMMMIISVNVFVNSFPNLANTFFQNMLSILFAGIGMYYAVTPWVEDFEGWRI